jgi:cellulose synthase A
MVKDAGISSDKHALIIPPFMSRGNRVHPMPISDSSVSSKFGKFEQL